MFIAGVLTLISRNYRIELENEVVRHLANNDEIDMLVAADQASHSLLGMLNF